MNQDDFIQAVKTAVHDAAITGVAKTLARPPGRKPHARLKQLSDWFNALPEEDRKQVLEIIRHSVHAAVFKSLCVLDGVTAIESTPEKGELRLDFQKEGKITHLNCSGAELLHDRYQTMVQDELFGE